MIGIRVSTHLVKVKSLSVHKKCSRLESPILFMIQSEERFTRLFYSCWNGCMFSHFVFVTST